MLLDRTIFFVSTALLQIVFGHATDLCNNDNLGIFGGHSIPIEAAPFVAALGYEAAAFTGFELGCGAAIVHDRFLLTTASCVTHIPPDLETLVSIGSEKYDHNNNNILMRIEKFVCHGSYEESTGKNDICLVKLQKRVPFGKNIGKINLPEINFEVKTGTMLNLTGWGGDLNYKLPHVLLQTTIPVVSHRCCHKADKAVDDTMLCAGSKGHGPCWGDEGAPLTQDNVLVGITSHWIKKNNEYLCGTGMEVYTKVTSFLGWINRTITSNL